MLDSFEVEAKISALMSSTDDEGLIDLIKEAKLAT
jgi:hypothetical protein